MNIDTSYYLLIVLSGFMFLWSFRKIGMARKQLSDFECLGFSTFFGIWILAGYSWLTSAHPESLKALVDNPLLAGSVLSSLGLLLGSGLAIAIGFIRGLWREWFLV